MLHRVDSSGSIPVDRYIYCTAPGATVVCQLLSPSTFLGTTENDDGGSDGSPLGFDTPQKRLSGGVVNVCC
jgi:hypothetical protein